MSVRDEGAMKVILSQFLTGSISIINYFVSSYLLRVAHKKCRCTVERAIGVLKSMFRWLCKKTGGAILYQEDTACNIIVSCMVLHNYCISRNMDYPVDTDIADMTATSRGHQ